MKVRMQDRRFRALLGLAGVLLVAVPLRGHQDRPVARVVYVVAERFSFTPSEITIDQGSRVELRIKSEDTTHGFRLIGPGEINVEIPRRGRGDARVAIEIAEPGDYVFECSRLCGAGHGFMRGRLRVRAKAATP